MSQKKIKNGGDEGSRWEPTWPRPTFGNNDDSESTEDKTSESAEDGGKDPIGADSSNHLPDPFGTAGDGTPDPFAPKRFFCHNHYLAVSSDGGIRGTKERNDPNTLFWLKNLGADETHRYKKRNQPGTLALLRFKNKQTGLYIAMDANSKLYTTDDEKSIDSVFQEFPYTGNWTGFFRYLHKKPDEDKGDDDENNDDDYDEIDDDDEEEEGGWYLGLRKNGEPKKGSKTGPDQNAVRFFKSM